MANEQNYQFARVLSMKDVSEINRVLGIIEGLTYAVQDSGVADGLVNAVERIEAVVNKENEDGDENTVTIPLKKRFKYAGDVFAALMKKGWSCTEAADFVNSFRDADAAELNRGRWIEYTHFMTCSECGTDWHYGDNDCDRFDYCPNCGADMRERKGNDV